MPVKVYIVDDPILINFIEDNDIDSFTEYLEYDDTIIFNEPETFDTETEACAFCSGIGYGLSEEAPVNRYPLRSCDSDSMQFIEAIENY